MQVILIGSDVVWEGTYLCGQDDFSEDRRLLFRVSMCGCYELETKAFQILFGRFKYVREIISQAMKSR